MLSSIYFIKMNFFRHEESLNIHYYSNHRTHPRLLKIKITADVINILNSTQREHFQQSYFYIEQAQSCNKSDLWVSYNNRSGYAVVFYFLIEFWDFFLS